MKHTTRSLLIACMMLIGAVVTTKSQEPTWQNAQRYGGIGKEFGAAIEVNGASVYSCGSFSATTIMGAALLTSSGGSDIYVGRFTQQGQAVWAQRAGGSGDDRATALAVSADGDVYVTGWFNGTVTFGLQQLVSAGGRDIFVARYNSNGVLQWVKRAGSAQDDMAEGIAIAGNNIYISGSFKDSTRFANLAMMRAVGKTDFFVASYNLSGTEQWSRQGGSTNMASALDIVATASGVYVGGSFTDSLKQVGVVVSAGGHDAFVAKYSSVGSFQWVRRWGRAQDDMINDMALTPNQRLVLGGTFKSDTINLGATALARPGTSGGFMARIDTVNGTPDWAVRVGGTGANAVTGVATDAVNAMYATGMFSAPYSQGAIALTHAGGTDVFAIKYTSAGVLEFARSAGGESDDAGNGVAAGAGGESYYTGTVFFRGIFDQITLGANGDDDAFVARLSAISGIDAGVVSILTPTVPFAQGGQQVSVVVKNYGTTRLDSVRISWTFNGTPQTTVRHTTAILPGQTATVVLGTPAFPARTLSTITATTLFPNGLTDNNDANDARTIQRGPGLSTGEYTVGGASPDFGSVQLANEYLHIAGVLGRVTMNIRSGNYEGPWEITTIPGLTGERRRIEFRRDDNQTTNPIISFNAIYPNNNYALTINGTDWISFTNINFSSLGTSAFSRVALLTNNTRAIRFNGCQFTVAANTTSTDNNFVITDNNIFDSLVVRNCTFTRGAVGLDLGESAVDRSHVIIESNSAQNFTVQGFSIADIVSPLITKNTAITNTTSVIGLSVSNTSGSAVITQNNNSIPSGAGIVLSGVVSAVDAPSLLANNMVKIGNATTQESYGIVVFNSQNCSLFHNTVNNSSTDRNQTSLFIENGGGIRLLNNMFYNSGGGRVLDVEFSMTNPLIASDFNNLYTNGPILSRWNNGITVDTIYSLQELRNKKTIDINSVARNTTFAADGVHLNFVDESLYGTPTIADIVPQDIDNQIRKNSYRGADEIIPVITLTKQPERTIACAGDNVVFEIRGTITNAGVLKYQWQKNGVNIMDSTRSRLVLRNVTFNNDGFYRCIVSGNSGADTVYSSIGQLSVTTKTDILRDPLSSYLLTGDNARFEVLAEAAPIVSLGKVRYTWLRGTTVLQNSQRISGQGTPVLQILSVQPSDTGRLYRVIVDGACGSDTSAYFSLLLPGGTFSVQPQDAQVCANEKVQLTAAVKTNVTNPTIIYQWRRNGNPITDDGRVTGTATPVLTINAVSSADTLGAYTLYVRIQELNSEFISNPVRVILKKATSIVTAPGNVNACPGKPVTLTVAAQGAAIRYQWQRNEQNIAGATTATLTINNLNEQSIGQYRVVVTGDCGTVTSANATVGLIDPAKFLIEPPAQIIANPGTQLVINIPAGGQIPITYQWYKNGVPLQNETLNPYFKNNITFADSGTYYCVARNVCDSVISKSVRVKIVPTSVEDIAYGESSDISITPNPASSTAQLSFVAHQASLYTLRIYDAAGRTVYVKQGITTQARETIDLSAETLGLVSGAYYCAVEIGLKRMVVPIVFIP